MGRKQSIKVVRITSDGLYKDMVGLLQGNIITLENSTRLYSKKHRYNIIFHLEVKREISLRKKRKKQKKALQKKVRKLFSS